MPFGRKLSGASTVTFLLAGLAFGQSETSSAPAAATTRADLWKRAKLQKQQTSAPLKLSLMERLFVEGEKRGFRLSPAGIHPTVGTVTTGSGPAFGASFGLFDVGGLPLDFSMGGEASTRMYQEFSLDIGELSHRDTTFTLQPLSRRLTTEFDEGSTHKKRGQTLFLDVSFDHFPQEDFYGIGPRSLRTNLSNYLYQSLTVEGVGGVQFNRWLGWSLRGGFLGINIQPGTDAEYPDVHAIFTPESTPGLSAVPDFVHVETALLADYRDKPGDAHKGGMFGLVWGHFNDRGSDRFRFQRVSVETRQYVPLWSNYRTFAVRFLTSFDRPSSGSEVPFFLMESLGGINSIRGFPEYRFRDRNLLLMSAEYRWDAAEFLEMVLFYDTGKVFSRPGDFDLTGLEKGFGGGLRIKNGRTVFLRLELGHSREGNELHLRLGPSF